MLKADLFIDGAFLDQVIKAVNEGKHPAKFNYEQFADKVCKLFGLERNRTHYYHCYPFEFKDATEKQKEFVKKRKIFLNSLQRTPRFVLRVGKTKAAQCRCQICKELLVCKKCKNSIMIRQKGADTRLAVDAVILALKKETEAIILIGGDEDFVNSFEEARKHVQTGLAYYNYLLHGGSARYSDELFNIFDERRELTPTFIKEFITNNE